MLKYELSFVGHNVDYSYFSEFTLLFHRKSEKKTKNTFKCPKKPAAVYDGSPNMIERGINAVDPINAELSFPEPRVIIIGAGMAGLSTAARLFDRGIENIVVLEAYERYSL